PRGAGTRGRPALIAQAGRNPDRLIHALNAPRRAAMFQAARRGMPARHGGRPWLEARMNEDALNTSVRKFLKKVGVTSQREIEKAVRDAASSGRLKGDALPAKATIKVEALGLTFDVDGDIEVE